MKFLVAGGPTGTAGIDVAGRRYEVGDEVEMTQKQAEWLIEQGYVVQAGKGVQIGVSSTPAPQPEPEPEPAVVEVVDANDDEIDEDGEEL